MLWAFVAWLPTLIPAACLCGIALFVGRLYLFEAFTCPTNSMAPTILGRHWEAPCPRCGSPAYGTPEDERWKLANKPVLMICSKELRSCEVANPAHVEHSGDRFIVNKFFSPRRWDIIVFRSPDDPKTCFCKRLVGLPGETVTIRDGAVWIDGKKQTPPDSCKGIEYLDSIGRWSGDLWGSEARPAKLGADEYFVLGDFSARAKDSRLWEKGAAGHPPYAVPASYIVGVVTHIYWPPERCRAPAVTLNRRSSIQTRSRRRRRVIHCCSNSSWVPILQESDFGMILVDRPPQRFVGGNAAKLQVADKGDKQRIVDRAVILRGNLKRRSQ